MFKYAHPVFLKGMEKEKNVTAFFAANFESKGEKVILHICGASFYRVTVNADTACHGMVRKNGTLYYFDTVDITEFVTEGINQIIIEVAGYGKNNQNNFIMAEVVAEDQTVAATGCNFISFMDAERVKETECDELGNFKEEYNVTGATMIKMNCSKVDVGPMHFRGTSKEYKYSYINVPKALEIGKITPYKNKELRYPIVLEKGEYALFDLEEEMTGFIRFAIKIEDKAKLTVSYGKTKEKTDGQIKLSLIDGEFDRENFHITDTRYIKITATEGDLAIYLVGLHKYNK